MKIKNILITLIGLFVFPLIVTAAELEEVDLTAMPNTFVNGEVADATQINENFEYLRNNIDLIKTLLEDITLETDAEPFSGTYKVEGVDTGLTACNSYLEVSQNTMSGTLTISDGNLSGSLTVYGQRIEAQAGEDYIFTREVKADYPNIPVSSTGVIGAGMGHDGGDIGQLSADGSMFTLSNPWQESSDCEHGGFTFLTGVRVP